MIPKNYEGGPKEIYAFIKYFSNKSFLDSMQNKIPILDNFKELVENKIWNKFE
jgi:hypothetical protein